ncbi:Ankyrin repeat-containing protein [Colletotrichum chlorophyti]|uniref:Ankyrin repeat-containing protein n=1 Tax=Colletotrichum chlorophyti TaxID=708187 RepID=A0A1Q8S4Z4_9PEZI|nr:Ankyrin repeat-containing protein [Colletotrichum chlorophyti]
MAGDNEEHEGASVKELLIEACRRNNTDLFNEVIADIKDEDELSRILNETTTVMGNHLYHEAASRGNYEIIDLLLDQPNFECDPVNRLEGDTPLHTAIRWINSEPPAQREFGNALVDMMLEAGSNPRVKNKGGLTALQLVDPRNTSLRDLIQKHEYASLNAGDFINVDASSAPAPKKSAPPVPGAQQFDAADDETDDDAEFSGSDDEERAEWERRRKERAARKS